jgi:hypothetical protein
MASLPDETGAGRDFDALFAELRSDLGEDNFRNFLVALSGRKPKEVKYHPETGRKKKQCKMKMDERGWTRYGGYSGDMIGILNDI